jgi:uncharacterized protein YcfJ
MFNSKNEKFVLSIMLVFFFVATSVRMAHATDVVASATVVSAQEHVSQQCYMSTVQPQYRQQESNNGGSVVPALMGTVLGAYAGNNVGGGNGRTIATAVGAVGGALFGSQYGGNSRPQYEQASAPQQVQQCTSQVVGYDVTYDLRGIIGHTLVSYRPGSTINVALSAM